jgi:hypothetical protein
VLTNAAGVYLINGISPGSQIITAIAVGYVSASVPCTILNNQTITVNFCMYPPAGILTGVVTDCSTGDPVVGAFITWGTYATYSVSGGHYTLTVYMTGPMTFQVSKQGFNLYYLELLFRYRVQLRLTLP